MISENTLQLLIRTCYSLNHLCQYVDIKLTCKISWLYTEGTILSILQSHITDEVLVPRLTDNKRETHTKPTCNLCSLLL